MKQTKQNAPQVAYNVQRHNNQRIVSFSVNSSESQYEGSGLTNSTTAAMVGKVVILILKF